MGDAVARRTHTRPKGGTHAHFQVKVMGDAVSTCTHTRPKRGYIRSRPPAHAQVNVMGNAVPKPVRTFEEGSFPDYILNVVEKEYGPDARPTPVQSQAWPVALSGRDCVNIAETVLSPLHPHPSGLTVSLSHSFSRVYTLVEQCRYNRLSTWLVNVTVCFAALRFDGWARVRLVSCLKL